MKIVFLLTVFWIQTYIVKGAPSCCTSKNVGGLEYTLLRVEDTSQFGCLTNCVYEKVGDPVPGRKYCFGTGDLKVECKGEDLTCAKSVTGDSSVYSSECYDKTLNEICAPVKNLLTHSDNEKYLGFDGLSTFWLGPDGNNANFTLDLGCEQTFDTIQLVNTHNSYHRNRATKLFNLYVGDTTKGPWTWVLETTLEDSQQQNDPLPLQYLPLETGEKTAQFVKFELIEHWGLGGGLQFFDIERNSTGTTISDVLLYCGERAKTLTGEMDLTSHATTFDLQCCHDGSITNTTCGNIVDGKIQNCSTACGTINCAKIVPDNEQEKCNHGENQMWIQQNTGFDCKMQHFNTPIECSGCNNEECVSDSACWFCKGYYNNCKCSDAADDRLKAKSYC